MKKTQLQVLLAARPIGLPTETDFETKEGSVSSPADGEVLVKVLYLSLDPAMRGWMDDRRSYIPPVQLGEVMRALGVGEVVESRHSSVSTGNLVSGLLGWQEYAVLGGKDLQAIPPGAPPTLALGPLGMIGMTAYFGLLDIGRPKHGETVLVSGAAGAVGSLVGQIARIQGCRVVGIAGSEDKGRWLTDELGFDGFVNYKTTQDLYRDIRSACPDGVDVFFDNVGGEILNQVLSCINTGARVVICGAISQYNATETPLGPSNYLALLVQRARMEGFVVFDYADRYREAGEEIAGWIRAGNLRYREDIVDGLENAPKALLKLFDGSNKGKLMVKVAAGGGHP